MKSGRDQSKSHLYQYRTTAQMAFWQANGAGLLAEQISGSLLHTIEGADHMMPFSHAEEVACAVASFLNAHNLK